VSDDVEEIYFREGIMIIRKTFSIFLFVCGAIVVSGTISTAAAQTPWQNDSNPCEAGFAPLAPWPEVGLMAAANQLLGITPPIKTTGLTPEDWGTVVYDSNQGVCWLADANLAGNPVIRAQLGVPEINPDGTMDWATALNFVNALNSYDHGRGFLGHNDWQLPTNPAADTTCSSINVDNFGALCTGSGLGNLYNIGLAQTYPASVVPRFFNTVWPFLNLQPGLYWAADPNNGGEATFSFNTGIKGGNTTLYNLFHVLPMTRTVLGPPLVGKGVLPYLSGPAAGKAVYDTLTGLSWTLNANLPAFDNFGVTNTMTIPPDKNPNTNRNKLTVPLVDEDGAVYLSAPVPPVLRCLDNNNMLTYTSGLTSQWIIAMNNAEYAGTNDWDLPCISDLQKLYSDMVITDGDDRLESPFAVGPFWLLQPGFYWACVAVNAVGSNGPCDYTQSAPGGLQWSFNFDDGFEGTDLVSKQFYVMVYYPAPNH
jgi:hypothetical protein